MRFAPVGILAAVLLGLAATGCGRPPSGHKDETSQNGPKGDPWDAVAKRFRKETDLSACKSALSTLNHELANREGVEKPAALSESAEKSLTGLVPMHDSDREEIHSAAFSPHDPVYIADCFYLRDAARSLAIPGLTPEQLADLGFAWVCRQVYLSPWLIDTGERVVAAALPPVAALRRGSGSALERMYVFLALLQQMGIDGCLIGSPDPGEVGQASALNADRKTVLAGGPARPFWAVGVRIERDKRSAIKLYDPWRGAPYPATLSQLKANPDSYKSWFEDSANFSGITVDDMKQATAFLAIPVNSLSPRMAMLQKKLKDQVDVALAIDPQALRDRFPDPKPAYWNPPNDRFAYGRAARTYLPVEKGGADRTERSPYNIYRGSLEAQLPSEQELTPVELRRAEIEQNKELVGDIKTRIRNYARGVFGAAFLEPPTPRERIQRGQFRDALRLLDETQGEFAKARDRVRLTRDSDQVMHDWVARAVELYGSFGRTGASGDTRAALDEHWKAQGAGLLLDRALGEVGQAEAAYLTALCQHEQAERAQARLEHPGTTNTAPLKEAAGKAWTTALNAWNGYREQHASAHSSWPAGRAEHVATLMARARQLARQ